MRTGQLLPNLSGQPTVGLESYPYASGVFNNLVANIAAFSTLTISGNYVYRAGGTDVPITDGGTGASSQASAAINILPGQSGYSGYTLKSDGINVLWGTIDSFPSQGGYSGYTLTTNGASVVWTGAKYAA